MGIRGARAHINRLKALNGPLVEFHVGRALFAAGQLIENEAALSIMRGSVEGGKHVRSKPGEAPNNETQTLTGSIETIQITPLKVRVIASAGHAVPLELGTSRMAARPFMRPARDKKKEKARDMVVKGLNAALRKSRSK